METMFHLLVLASSPPKGSVGKGTASIGGVLTGAIGKRMLIDSKLSQLVAIGDRMVLYFSRRVGEGD